MDTNSDSSLLDHITKIFDEALSFAADCQTGTTWRQSPGYARRVLDLLTFRDRHPSRDAWLVDYAHRINERIDYQIRHNLVGGQTMNELAELVMKSGVY